MKKYLAVVFFVFIFIFFGWFLSKVGIIKNLDEILTDAKIRYFAPKTEVSDKLVLILLDEATMKELPYRSPVPRDFLYQLNEKILASGPKAIGYDIFFKDPTVGSSDERLAGSFKKGDVFAVSAGKTSDEGKEYEDLPMELFLNSFKNVGLSDLPFSSSDAVVRYSQFQFDIGGQKRPSFVSLFYDQVHNQNVRIRFISQEDSFKKFPAHIVAKGLVPKDWLNDKIVLVGAAYDDGTDAYITPYYSARYNYKRMPGVEIHANVLNQLLTNQFYYSVSQKSVWFTFLMLGVISSLLFLYGSIWRGVFGALILTLVIFVGSILVFNKACLIVPIVPFAGAVLVTFGASLGFRFITEGKQKRFIKSVFARYVPPAVVDKMIADPKLLTLGGEQREITCLFTDIASFTTISEKLDPKTLVEFLNQYLDKLTRIIFKYGGTLDKYEGDAIIAFFGAPVPLLNHRESALLAAIEMQRGSEEISKIWKEKCDREIVTRIGVNSGQAVVGNMGSDLRFDYTAIGDTMNLASRLEGANKFFNTTILASSSVLKPPMSSEILTRPVALLKVKGKTEAIKVCEIIGFKSSLPEEVVKKALSCPEPSEVVELTSK